MNMDRAIISAEHLVGNLWFNLDALPLIAGRLEPESMRLVAGSQAAMAYSEMCRLLRSESEKLSAGALESGLKSQGFDFDWLAKLQSRVLPESTESLYGYIDEVNNAADLRSLQVHCLGAIEGAKADDAKADALTAQLMEQLSNVNKSAATVQPVQAATDSIRKRLEKVRSGEASWGAHTGFVDLDRLMRLVDSELLLIAGRPSMGKTQLGLQIAINRAQSLLTDNERGQVLIFSSEMSKDELFLRGACSFAGVNSDRIVTNQAKEEEWRAVDEALSFFDMLPISIDDTPGAYTDQVYFRSVMANAQKPVRLILADHTELFNTKAESETLRVSNIVRSFKGVARVVNAPFIDLHQLGRDVDDRTDKQPMLSDLKYAGEAHADKVIFIHRPEYYLKRNIACQCDAADREGVAITTLAKNRNGPVGRVRLAFIEKYAKFGNLERTIRHELN